MLTDLQNCGVEDILIACVDGLKGFPAAIQSIFFNTEVQMCVIHQIRKSMHYVCVGLGVVSLLKFLYELCRIDLSSKTKKSANSVQG